MFDGLSAWFSTSVSKKKRKLWVEHGGVETPMEDAQFIFSQDTTATDTERVFESEPYIEEHLAVFHPNYVIECVKRGNIQHVVLGKYFFPPGDVQTIAREQLQYQWDLDGNASDAEPINLSDEEEAETVWRCQNKEPAPMSKGQNKEPAPMLMGQNKEPMPVSKGQNKEPMPVSKGQNKEPMPVSKGQNKEPAPISRGQNKELTPVSMDQNKEPASEQMKVQYKNSHQSKTTCSVLLESDKCGQPHINVTKARAALPGTSRDVYTKDNVKQSKGNSNKSVIDSIGSNQPSICIDTRVEMDKSPRRHSRTATDRNESGVTQENTLTKRKSPRKGKSPSKCSDTDSTNRKRKHEETSTRQLSKDQNINKEEEVLRLEELAIVSGDLADFMIGTKGCELVQI